MLWFRSAAVVFMVLAGLLAFSIGMSAFVTCVAPAAERSMDTDPYYNGTLFFYILVILQAICMTSAAAFGFVVAFRVWKNNLQMDHKLRHLFTLWLATLSFSMFAGFLIGILGLVRYKEAQEEITALYEIFARYSQDIKFVGSFERIQREHSCCGINGPDDWYSAQFKSSGSGGSMGMEMSYMGIGSPSTGKCHLTPPTFPMGCGKAIREIIYYDQAVYSSLIIFQTALAIAAAALSWYCFFYWIEKEVIIIPEDEVSNLVVVEPESSVSTMYSTNSSGSIPSSWAGSSYSSNGSLYTRYSRPESRSRYSQLGDPSTRQVLGSRFTYSGYAGSRSYYPNSRRHADISSNVMGLGGSAPTVGGPFAAYHYPDRSDAGQSINNNHIAQDYSYNYPGNPSRYPYYRGSNGTAFTGVSASRGAPTTQFYDSRMTTRGNGYRRPSQAPNHGLHHGHYISTLNPEDSYRGGPSQYLHETRYLNQDESQLSRQVGHSLSHHHQEHVHKKHSFNHMLHKQEKALGGKVLGEMHINHSRDPDPLNAQMDTAKGSRGHRAHHATVFIIKNKKQKKSKTLLGTPEKGHGQTGHLAEDIIDMSGGAAAVKSLVDDIQLPVEHNPDLGHENYVNKLHQARKKKGELDHPDPDNPGHGAVHQRGDKISAPSIDGSQAQSLMDALLHAPKPKKPSEHAIKPHEVVQHDTHHHHPHDNHHHHSDHSNHHHHDNHHHSDHSNHHHHDNHNHSNHHHNHDGGHHHTHSYNPHEHHSSTEILYKNSYSFV